MVWCVLVSVVLHALVLLSLSGVDAPAPPAKALLVLSARLAPIATAPSVEPSQPKRQPQAEVPPAPKPVATPVATPAPVPRTAPAKPAAVPASAPQIKAPGEAVRAAPSEPAAAASPAAAGASAMPATGSPGRPAVSAPAGSPTETTAKSGSDADAGTKEQYRLALIVATRRYKRYPAIAMEKGWQGRVEVRMVIGANGMLASASVKASSGHEVLDNQAMDMLKKGKPLVQIPASLRGREFSIDVPVIFNLESPNS